MCGGIKRWFCVTSDVRLTSVCRVQNADILKPCIVDLWAFASRSSCVSNLVITDKNIVMDTHKLHYAWPWIVTAVVVLSSLTTNWWCCRLGFFFVRKVGFHYYINRNFLIIRQIKIRPLYKSQSRRSQELSRHELRKRNTGTFDWQRCLRLYIIKHTVQLICEKKELTV